MTLGRRPLTELANRRRHVIRPFLLLAGGWFLLSLVVASLALMAVETASASPRS